MNVFIDNAIVDITKSIQAAAFQCAPKEINFNH